MKANEIIREVMKLKCVRPTDLAASLNIKKNVLSERLGQKNISIGKMDEMLRVLDYKMVVVPREADVPDGGFEIEMNGEEEEHTESPNRSEALPVGEKLNADELAAALLACIRGDDSVGR